MRFQYWNCTSAWVFSCKFAAYFYNIFSLEHLWMAALYRAYAAKLTGKSVCVVADDTDLFIPLLHVSINCNETLYFRQGTTTSRDSITYHNVTLLSSHLEEKIWAILPAFHSLTGSDFTKPFFGRSKINSFKKLLSKPESNESMKTDHADIEKVMYFVLHVILIVRNEKNHLEKSLCDAVCWKKQKKKFTPTKSLPPDQKSLTMKILRAHSVSHSWVNCLDCNYQSSE